MNPNTNRQVEKTNGDIIRSRIQGEHFKTAVQQVLPKHLTPERFVRVALMAMTRVPKLADCDQASLIQCLLTLSQLGLEPDGRRAHLIPFGNQCQLIVDYKGYVELLMNTGLVSMIHADIVCKNDVFEWDRGAVTKHTYGWEDRGDVVGVYAIIKFKDGTEKADRMSRSDVEAVRARSRAKNSGPWVTDWNEMAKKTVFRRLVKWAKLSPEQRDAIEADDDQFDHRPAESVKGAFGSDTTVSIFTPEEQKTLSESTDHPPGLEPKEQAASEPPKPTPAPKKTKASEKPAEQPPAPASSEPAASPAPAASGLRNAKTELAAWMNDRGFGWGQLKPHVEKICGSWAETITRFEELNMKQAEAIFAARGDIENAVIGAPSNS